MIDVVFLLLVFFMLAARFGMDGVRPLALPGAGGGDWQGAPRLVEVWPARLAVNGVPVEAAALAGALEGLGGVEVLLRPRAGADVQRVLDVSDALAAAGFAPLLVAGE